MTHCVITVTRMPTLSLLALGWFGLLGMTWLFPTLARSLWKFKQTQAPRRRLMLVGPSARPLRVSILIPAHNEQSNLPRTLKSIEQAIIHAMVHAPGAPPEISIHVGADGCSDKTSQMAREAGAFVHEYEAQGKWQTLKSLTSASGEADWVIFADSGIEWSPGFLTTALELFRDPDLVGVAPTYRVLDGGAIERLLWSVERHFKAIEAQAGGPVSIHGATVAYRRPELLKAFSILGNIQWLNDDVVIPLTLRSLYPHRRIHYSTEIYSIDQLNSKRTEDRAKNVASIAEFRRRRRLVMGNLQWVAHALVGSDEATAVPRLLALRRVFRIFWAYWGLALVLGVSCLVFDARTVFAFAGGMACLALAIRTRRNSNLLDAAAASLLAPYYLATYSASERTAWK